MIIRYSILAVLFLCVSAFGQTPEQSFDAANQAYQAGKYADAAAKYEAIVHGGVANGELYYNLGNAYYKAGNVSRAILNYERALKLMPNDDDLRHNLQLANLMITDKLEPTPRLFVWDWWDSIKASFSLGGITWLSYLFYVLSVGSIIVVLLAPSYALRRVGFISSFVFALCLTVCLVIFAGKMNAVRNDDTAIVTTTVTTVKNSPDPKSTDAFVLHGGVKVYITDKVNQWFKIRLTDGKVGWMDQRAAEII